MNQTRTTSTRGTAVPIETHYHPCMGFCPPDSPTAASFAAETRAATADQIAIACAVKASDAYTEIEARAWWAAAKLARSFAGGADVAG